MTLHQCILPSVISVHRHLTAANEITEPESLTFLKVFALLGRQSRFYINVYCHLVFSVTRRSRTDVVHLLTY